MKNQLDLTEWKKEIVADYLAKKDEVNFLRIFTKYLDMLKATREKTVIREEKDVVRVAEWQFKRWFWSFLEHAVKLHTKVLYFVPDGSETFDMKYILMIFNHSGIRIKSR